MNTTLNITYWSDFSCPYCYIGETRLKKAINNLGLEDSVTLTPKAFRLDPNAPLKSIGTTQDRFAKKYGISYEQAGQQIEHIADLGRKEGLDFNYASTLFTNNMDAHRIIKWLQVKNPGLVDSVQEALFATYFSKNKELANQQVLLEITSQMGLDKDVVKDMLDSEDFKNQVLLEEQNAHQLGIRGVPYFLIGDELVVAGAQTQEGFEQALQEMIHKHTASDKVGACGIDGCLI